MKWCLDEAEQTKTGSFKYSVCVWWKWYKRCLCPQRWPTVSFGFGQSNYCLLSFCRKIQTRKSNEIYFREHPEISHMVNAFMRYSSFFLYMYSCREVLEQQPDDIREYAAGYPFEFFMIKLKISSQTLIWSKRLKQYKKRISWRREYVI